MARRLAAILAADVVGYSRLMAADEAGTHARLKALRRHFIEPTIAEHHGRVAKLMGDGALVATSATPTEWRANATKRWRSSIGCRVERSGSMWLPYAFAPLYVGLGDKDKAIEAL
jgi:class 3 adenylate cyclase